MSTLGHVYLAYAIGLGVFGVYALRLWLTARRVDARALSHDDH